MNIVTNSQHEFKIGKYFVNVGTLDLAIHDTSDNQRCVLSEEMDTQEMKRLAEALYLAATIREKSKELLEQEILSDLEFDELMGGVEYV